MPPVSMGTLEELGEAFLAELFPQALAAPGNLDVLYLVDHVLPRHGIQIYPASELELGPDREAATDWEGSGEITILLREDLWHSLREGGRRANRARSTVVHELSHALLHVPYLRAAARVQPRDAMLNRRTPREKLPAYRDPEWQAFGLAGCILMPRKHIEQLLSRGFSESQMADTFGVSVAMLRSHMRRLKMTG